MEQDETEYHTPPNCTMSAKSKHIQSVLAFKPNTQFPFESVSMVTDSKVHIMLSNSGDFQIQSWMEPFDGLWRD